MPRSIREVYPTYGPEHRLGPKWDHRSALNCWCRPQLKTLCQSCDPEEPDPQCWACGGLGLVLVGFDDGVIPLIIVHNDEEMLR